ncbi:MAG: response regulator [Deltaproteobacteria bacterium]|nr:response regulator [Deltaproteobacteria bacterium]
MSNGTVLVVEDDEDLLHMLAYNLSKRGYHTVTALDGLVACQLIEEERPDLILLDIMLPGMDGWQVCEAIRNHKQDGISEIPIIMLTALGSPKQKLKGIEMGADDYIPKPFSIKEVLLKVDRLIQREIKKKHLNTVVKELEAKDAQRTDFQNMLFHELKNQLFIIGGYSRRIVEKRCRTPETYQQCAGVIRECSRSLNSLTEEVLLLSRLEAGDFPLPAKDVSIKETVVQIVSVLSKQADEKGVGIHVETTGNIQKIRLNPTAVKVAISNLIENAVKYSPHESEVTVHISVEKGTLVVVDVEDRGPGIPEEDRDKIFDRYFRGKSVKNRTKGTGLGLYISKTLIQSMGGAIDLKRSDANGTCFSVVFYPLPTSSTPQYH